MRLGLVDIEKCIEDYGKRIDKVLTDKDVDVYMFPQIWPSGALGFEQRIGASVLTVAYTVIITVDNLTAGVYFNGEFAYLIKKTNNKFYTDLSERNMVPVGKEEIYETEYTENKLKEIKAENFIFD